MHQQLFGTIEAESFTGRTMLCIDADRPNEAAIHWWDPINPGAPPSAAAVCEMRRSSSGRLDFQPKLLYRLDKGFGLYLPRLTSAESDSFKKATLFLEPDGEGFKGEATVATGERFLVSFGEVLAAARVKAVTCQSWDEFKTWATISRDRDDAAAFRGR